MSLPAKTKSRASQFKKLQPKRTLDFDPEDDRPLQRPDDDEDASDSEADEANARARDHYVSVSESKMRKKDGVSLGPAYVGRSVRRDDMEDESEEDEDEDESEDAEDDDEDSEALLEDDGINGVSLISNDSAAEPESDEDSEHPDDSPSPSDSEQAENDAATTSTLKQLLSAPPRTIPSTSDSAKGLAVVQQRKAFESLLNTRIRLQPALIASNTLLTHECPPAPSLAPAIAGARALFSSLCTLRSLKRPNPTTSLSTLWTTLATAEEGSAPKRRATLERWSQRTQTVPTTARNLSAATPTTVLDSIAASLADPSAQVARTRLPRACAPAQARDPALAIGRGASLYDDTDFYGALLKELLAARNVDASGVVLAGGGGGEDAAREYRGARAAKSKRPGVDVRASKGRKLKYGVHEKLVNFMASEDRGGWGERAAGELFAGLFGGAASDALDEGVEDDEGGGGLRLFRA